MGLSTVLSPTLRPAARTVTASVRWHAEGVRRAASRSARPRTRGICLHLGSFAGSGHGGSLWSRCTTFCIAPDPVVNSGHATETDLPILNRSASMWTRRGRGSRRGSHRVRGLWRDGGWTSVLPHCHKSTKDHLAKSVRSPDLVVVTPVRCSVRSVIKWNLKWRWWSSSMVPRCCPRVRAACSVLTRKADCGVETGFL